MQEFKSVSATVMINMSLLTEMYNRSQHPFLTQIFPSENGKSVNMVLSQYPTNLQYWYKYVPVMELCITQIFKSSIVMYCLIRIHYRRLVGV